MDCCTHETTPSGLVSNFVCVYVPVTNFQPKTKTWWGRVCAGLGARTIVDATTSGAWTDLGDTLLTGEALEAHVEHLLEEDPPAGTPHLNVNFDDAGVNCQFTCLHRMDDPDDIADAVHSFVNWAAAGHVVVVVAGELTRFEVLRPLVKHAHWIFASECAQHKVMQVCGVQPHQIKAEPKLVVERSLLL